MDRAPAHARIDVHVWTTHLDDWSSGDTRWLDVADLRRAAGLRHADDRLRTALAAVVARLAVADDLGLPVEEAQLVRACGRCGGAHGKPEVVSGRTHVSIAHSGDLVVVATSRHAALGVDVEQVPSTAPEIRAVLGRGERAADTDELITLWCRKESAVKATGDGLFTPLHEVLVTAAGAPAALREYRGRPVPAVLHDLDLPPGYRGALTVLDPGPLRVHPHDGAHLLRRWRRTVVAPSPRKAVAS